MCVLPLYGMIEGRIDFVKLHEHSNLIQQCCDLLNSEWPRSKSSRSVTLRTSRDELPTCFCLVQCGQVIGHAKLSPFLNHPGSCTVHSVLIHPEYRKKGLGRMLMEKCEDYANSMGMHTVYLSTDDQQGFYTSLGYVKCEPFSIYGSSPIRRCSTSSHSMNSCSEKVEAEPVQCRASSQTSLSSPPSPPPLPARQIQNCTERTSKTFMKKILNTK